jgi:hypothetical protein
LKIWEWKKLTESLKDYSTGFLKLVNQMKAYGEDMTDRRIIEKILISLPEKFDPMAAVIEETKDLRVKHYLKLGVEESHQSNILKYLVVFVMLKFQRS